MNNLDLDKETIEDYILSQLYMGVVETLKKNQAGRLTKTATQPGVTEYILEMDVVI